MMLTSCILVQEEDNFVKIDDQANPNNVAPLSYSYDNKGYFPIKDSLWASSQIYIRYQGGFVYDWEVLINNEIYLPYGNDVNIVSISKSILPNTNNIITIRERVKSGTGSLADKALAEFAEFEFQFVLIRDESVFTPQISSVAFQDGSVKVQWNKFPRSDFQYYKLVKLIRQNNGLKEYRTFQFSDSKQTSFMDSTYVGGYITYQLVLNNGGDKISAAYPFNYIYNPKATLEKTGDHFKLSFAPPPFYKNVKYYKTSFYNYKNGTEIVTTANVSNIEYSMDIPGPLLFGPSRKYIITPVAKVDEIKDGDQWGVSGVTSYGTPIKLYPGHYLHHSKLPFLYAYVSTGANVGTLYKIDDTSFMALDSASFPGGSSSMLSENMIISANGLYCYFIVGDKIIRFDPESLQVISTVSVNILSNPPYNIIDYKVGTRVTDDNRIYFHGSYPCVIDMNTNTTLFSSQYQTSPGHLSPDGTFLVLGSNVYKFNGTQYVLDHTLPYSNIDYRQFSDHYPTQLFITRYDPYRILMYDCLTKSEVYSSEAYFEYYSITFNQALGKISGIDRNQRKVFDIAKRELKNAQVDYLYGYYFMGDAFITSAPVNSVYYFLKDYYY